MVQNTRVAYLSNDIEGVWTGYIEKVRCVCKKVHGEGRFFRVPVDPC